MNSSFAMWLAMGCADKIDSGSRPPVAAEVSVSYVRGENWGFSPSVVPLGTVALGLSDLSDGNGGVVRLLPFGQEPWVEPEVALVDSAVFDITPASLQSAQGRRLGGTMDARGDLGSLAADEQLAGTPILRHRLSLYRGLEGHATREFADAWWDFTEYGPFFFPGDVAGLDGNGDGDEELWVHFSDVDQLLCPVDPGVFGGQPEPVPTDCFLGCVNARPLGASTLDVDGDGRVEVGVACEGGGGKAGYEDVLFIDGAAPDGSSIDAVVLSSIVGIDADYYWWASSGLFPDLGVAGGSDGVFVSWQSLDPEDPCVGWVTEVPASGVTEARDGTRACAPTGAPGVIDLAGSGSSAHVLLASDTTVWSAPLDGFSDSWTELADVGEPIIGLRAAQGNRAAAILADGLALMWYDGVLEDSSWFAGLTSRATTAGRL